MVAGPGAKSNKHVPAAPKAKSESNESKYTSNASHASLKAKLQAVPPKEDKYTVDVNSSVVLATHKHDGETEDGKRELPTTDQTSTPAAEVPQAKQRSSKRMRRQRIQSVERQRRFRRKRNNREDEVSSQAEKANTDAKLDRYAISKTKDKKK